jgi:hypothetical protein
MRGRRKTKQLTLIRQVRQNTIRLCSSLLFSVCLCIQLKNIPRESIANLFV